MSFREPWSDGRPGNDWETTGNRTHKACKSCLNLSRSHGCYFCNKTVYVWCWETEICSNVSIIIVHFKPFSRLFPFWWKLLQSFSDESAELLTFFRTNFKKNQWQSGITVQCMPKRGSCLNLQLLCYTLFKSLTLVSLKSCWMLFFVSSLFSIVLSLLFHFDSCSQDNCDFYAFLAVDESLNFFFFFLFRTDTLTSQRGFRQQDPKEWLSHRILPNWTN